MLTLGSIVVSLQNSPCLGSIAGAISDRPIYCIDGLEHPRRSITDAGAHP
jgi:hypothetical protein